MKKAIAGGSDQELAASSEADADSVLIHPKTHVVQAVRFSPGRSTWKVIDPSIQADFDGIAKLHDGDFSVDRPRPGRQDLARRLSPPTAGRSPITPGTERPRKGTFLFVHQPKLQGLALAEMKPVSIKARDGLNLRGYLTLPVGLEPRNLPMVLMVHGGPWGRDSWGYNPYGPVVRQPRLRLSAGQLPGIDRIRQGVPERRQQAVGQGDARRPDRRLPVGRRAGLRRRQEDRRLRRLLRRLCRARGRHLHARVLRLRGRHRGAVEPEDADQVDPALLEADAVDVRRADGQHRRPQGRRADQGTPRRCSRPTRSSARC